MKYKLINSVSKIETICDKITIEGFDYYYIDERPKMLEWFFDRLDLISSVPVYQRNNKQKSYEGCYKIICTNNPNIDIPKVVDEVEELSEKFIGCKYEDIEDSIDQIGYDSFKRGYNKSQETHPFSEEDIIEFSEFCSNNAHIKNDGEWLYKSGIYTTKELLQLWKEQQPKIIYYE